MMHWNAFLADAPAPSQSATAPAAQTTTTQGAPSAQPNQPTPLFASPIFLLVLVVVMMYFMLFRPQQQRAKQQAKLLANLKSGDKVATSSGIVGVVITVKDKTVTLRSGDAKMELTKSSVTEILQSDEGTQASP